MINGDSMNCLVLAAGKSTRLAALTGGAPKPLTPVAGVPVLHRNLRWLAGAGISEAYVNLHHRGAEIKASVGDGSAFGLRVHWSEEDPILGTAGAAKNLEQQLRAGGAKQFLVVYGDNIFGFDLRTLIDAHRNAALTMAVFDPARSLNTGIAGGRVLADGSGRITHFTEGGVDCSAGFQPAGDVSGRQDACGTYVNAACYVCNIELLDQIPAPPQASDWARDIFPALLALGVPLRAHVIEGFCLGIDTPESYHIAEALFREGKAL